MVVRSATPASTFLFRSGWAVRRVEPNRQQVSNGVENETSEELEPTKPSIYWSETGLSLQGGGSPTLLYFFVGHRAGTYPVRLKLYDDSDQPRKLNVDSTFTILTGSWTQREDEPHLNLSAMSSDGTGTS